MIRGATAPGQVVALDVGLCRPQKSSSRGPAHARSDMACREPDPSANRHFDETPCRGLEQRAEAGAPLRVIDINKTFATPEGDIHVLENVSFDVAPGEFVSVIGPSGCGKTTLFNIVGGLANDFDGKVVLNGVEASARRQSMGMVFQEEFDLPLADGHRERRLPARGRRHGAARAARARPPFHPPGRIGRFREPLSSRIVWRHAPAHRHCPHPRL